MSSNQSREVAVRAFAGEFNDATHLFKESDDDMAPKYALLPTGVRANRVFVVGTVTEVEDVGEDQEYWKARVVDPTGTYFVYAGQYQPQASSFFKQVETPEFVSVVGKPRTFETDSGTMRVTLRPEHVAVVDRTTKANWLVETANRTLDRIDVFDGDDMTDDQMAATKKYDLTISSMDEYHDYVEEAIATIEI